MGLIAALLLPLLFIAIPVGLSIRARRHKQAALVSAICLITPAMAGIAAFWVSEPGHTDVSANLLENAAVGLMAYMAVAILLPLFCASVLWELGKFKSERQR